MTKERLAEIREILRGQFGQDLAPFERVAIELLAALDQKERTMNSPLTDKESAERLEAIKARVEKATKGPWTRLAEYVIGGEETDAELHLHRAICTASEDGTNNDMDFIAHSRADIEYLLEKLDAAERMAVAIADDQRSTGPFKPSQNTLSALAAFRAAGKETP